VIVVVMLAACFVSQRAYASWVPRSVSGKIFAPVVLRKGLASMAGRVAGIAREVSGVSDHAVTIQGWEIVSEKMKHDDSEESVTAYPKTIIDSDIDEDGETEIVRIHTYLEMDMTPQMFQIFRLHFMAEVHDPGSIQDEDALIAEVAEKAKTKDVNLFEFAALHLPNQAFYDPSQDYRYYLNDDGIFYIKNLSADAYRPVKTEVAGDTMSWAVDDASNVFTRATFTSTSLEYLFGP
jgi:hypothetical protein